MPEEVKRKISKSRLGIEPYNKNLKWSEKRRRSLTKKGRKLQGKPRADKTECPKGHEYSHENTYIAKAGNRQCRTCTRERMRKLRLKRRLININDDILVII